MRNELGNNGGFWRRAWGGVLLVCLVAANNALGANTTATLYWYSGGNVVSPPSAYYLYVSVDGGAFSATGPHQSGAVVASASAGQSYRFRYQLSSGQIFGPWVFDSGGASYTLNIKREDGTEFIPEVETFTNYTHCIEWKNNTGSFKPGVILHCDGTQDLVVIGAGNTFTQCFTNQCAGDSQLFIREYVGQDSNDYVQPSTATNTTDSGSVVTNQTTVTTSGPVSSTDGGITPDGTTNADDNAVDDYSPTNRAYGSGEAATGDDVKSAANAIIKANQESHERTRKAFEDVFGDGIEGFDSDGIITALAFVEDEIFAASVVAQTNSLLSRLSSEGLLGQVNSNLTFFGNGASSNAQFFGEGTLSNIAYWGEAGVSNGNWWSSNFMFWTTNGSGLNEDGDGEDTAEDANDEWEDALGGAAGTTMSNAITAGGSSLLFNLFTPGFALADLTVMDFRPASWRSEMTAFAAASRAVLSLTFLVVLWWAMWRDFDAKWGHLMGASTQVGKTVSSTTALGVVGQPVRLGFAVAVTLGLAGLPTALVAAWANFGISTVLWSSPVAVATAAASAADASLDTPMAGVWEWITSFFPFSVMMTSIFNYLVWNYTSVTFLNVWYVILRFLPVLVLLAVPAGAADVILDNRTSHPVAVHYSSVVDWFEPGERRIELPVEFILSGGGGTNNLDFEVSSSEVTRVIVRDSTTEQTIVGEVQGELGFRWGFERGFIVGSSLAMIAIVAVYGRRIMRVAFGGYSE